MEITLDLGTHQRVAASRTGVKLTDSPLFYYGVLRDGLFGTFGL